MINRHLLLRPRDAAPTTPALPSPLVGGYLAAVQGLIARRVTDSQKLKQVAGCLLDDYE